MHTKTTAVKKKTAKKVSASARRLAAKTAKKQLVYADNQQSFWVRNGQILNSLVALRDALSAMEKDVYLYHASKDKNDFANWVEAVLCDGHCAADLRKAKTPASAKATVAKHLKLYSF